MIVRAACLSLLLLAGPAAGAPSGASATPAARSDPAFALRLYGQLARDGDDVFFSPFSVANALGMTAAGARGETARQMAAVLGGTADSLAASLGPLARELTAAGRPYDFTVANALWVDRAFALRPTFVSGVRGRYGAGVFAVDFRRAAEPARRRINGWVERQTRDLIRDLLPAGSVGAMTRLVLTNAVYFKGTWATPFDSQATRPEPFTRADGSRRDVPMMRHPELRTGFARLDGLKALEMGYKGEDLSMVVLLPDAAGGLADLERRLSAPVLARWLAALDRKPVDVWLPRFKLEAAYELKPALSALGMPAAFDASRADFGGMATAAAGRRLFVSAVVHKAFVEVNEVGTKAAAATGVVVGVTAVMPVETAEFRADHPFLFLIRHRPSGAILFMGRVTDPGK